MDIEIEIDKNLKSFVNAMKDRLDDDWDAVIAIAGKERSGKSSLSCLLGFMLDDNFDLQRNIAYLPNHQEIEEKFKALKSKQYFSIDEAIKAMYKMRFMDKLQVRINEMYATEAWQNKITALCIPRFTDLNEFFRNNRVMVWIQVIGRGVAVAFIQDEKNIFHGDPWHMKENDKLMAMAQRRKKYVEMTLEDSISAYKKSKNFYFAFTFPKLPDEIDKRYKDLKVSYRDVEVEKDRNLRHEVIIQLNDKNIKQNEIASIVKCSPAYVSMVLKRYSKLKNKDIKT